MPGSESGAGSGGHHHTVWLRLMEAPRVALANLVARAEPDLTLDEICAALDNAAASDAELVGVLPELLRRAWHERATSSGHATMRPGKITVDLQIGAPLASVNCGGGHSTVGCYDRGSATN